MAVWRSRLYRFAIPAVLAGPCSSMPHSGVLLGEILCSMSTSQRYMDNIEKDVRDNSDNLVTQWR